MVVKRYRLILTMAAGAFAGIALLGGALPANAAQSATTAHANVSRHAIKGQQCVSEETARGLDTLCARAVKHLPLNARDRAQRSRALAGAAGSAGASPSADAAAPASVTGSGSPPSQCNFQSTVTSSIQPDRFTSCTESFVIVNDLSNGAVVGTLHTETWQWVTDDQSGNAADWNHGVVLNTYAGTGTLANGGTFQEYSLCNGGASAGGCNWTSSSIASGTPVIMGPNQTYSFWWLETDNAGKIASQSNVDDFFDTIIGTDVVFTNESGNSTSWDDPQFNNQKFVQRCDNMVPGVGCVDDAVTPTVVYDSTTHPLVAAVAQHIYNAQNGGLQHKWGEPSNPLTHDTNSADAQANRRAACANVALQPGQTCDEFPLASTYEGAAFQSDYSAVAVPKFANDSQGGITGNFYTTNRVIDGDQFYANAVLSNGTRSW